MDDGTLKVEGWYEIKNGDNYRLIKNRLTDQMLAALCQCVAAANTQYQTNTFMSNGWTSKSTYMVLGHDSVTNTTHDMAALILPIGPSPGTKANSQDGSIDVSVPGSYKVVYTAIWGAGTVSGYLGEIGLYLYSWNKALSWNATVGHMSGPYMVSRLAHSETGFGFTIDDTKALSVTWYINFYF